MDEMAYDITSRLFMQNLIFWKDRLKASRGQLAAIVNENNNYFFNMADVVNSL